MTVYATIADLEARHRDQLTLIAADEQTGERDDVRIIAGLEDASIEIRAILAARYSSAELAGLDVDGLAILRMYCGDIAFYKIALAFSRVTDEIRDRRNDAIKRLEAIAAGKGALPSAGGGSSVGGSDDGEVGQNEVILDAPERVFTRKRLGRI